jgi:SmpA / OmlA family
MRRKTWIAIAALFVIAILLAIAIPVLLPPTPGVTYANYSRIEKGMTREQVEAVLGKPNAQHPFEVELEKISLKEELQWSSAEDDDVQVFFDRNNLVRGSLWNGQSDERNGVQKLMDRLLWFAKPPPPRIKIRVTVTLSSLERR